MADRRRDKLKAALVEAAEARIARSGVASLRARDVTKDAGCALGSLYNAFEDLDFLILAVNSRTLGKLDAALQEASSREAEPTAQLEAMAAAYLNFARKHTALWQALFDHRMPPGVAVPDWHISEHAALIQRVAAPLARLNAGCDQDVVLQRARTIFSAVHGVVQLSLEDRFVALSPEILDDEVSVVVERLIAPTTTNR